MADIKDGGSAFPIFFEGGQNNGEQPFFAEGMSLRDWFAGQALAAIIAKVPIEYTTEDKTELVLGVVLGAYDYADAMLAKRDRK